MRIFVQNLEEVELISKLLSAVHELGVIDLMEEEDGKENGMEQMLSADDYRILRETVSGDRVGIVMDANESLLYYDDAEFITGLCSKCGEQTQGLYDADLITYTEAIRMQSPEGQKNWRCYDCQQREAMA
ncbi:hypothetical protein [Paenibacillus piscarius]|uniref:hypothetical protein n=1 Tax=Paenibacillus piscarius TaxID=1089681 RepID=UPI001EE87945|nr:hypothetical protein [Paenibacillus piscarius]